MSLTIAQVRDDLLSKLGIEDSSRATSLQTQDVLIAINSAMQTLQSAGYDYFTREVISGTFSAGSTIVTLSGVQAVIGPIRVTNGANANQGLRSLNSRGEYDQYARIYGDSTSWAVPSGEPVAYWVENLRNGTSGDINQINIRCVPVPAQARTFEAEVVKDAPAYTSADLTAGTTVLPIAQNYTESIFLPLARLNISRSSQFSRPDLLAGITADAQVAYQRLGLSGGFPPQRTGNPPREIVKDEDR